MRPIDADAALKTLRKCQTYLYDARDSELKIELSSAEAAINNLPTIQPEKTQPFSEGTTKDATSELIDRQQAIDAIEKNACNTQRMIDAINGLPSAQREQKNGHWEDVPHKSVEHGEVVVDGKTVRCSVCRHAEKGWNKGMNYCPHCGAKMKGERQK